MAENTWGFTGVKFHPEISGVIFPCCYSPLTKLDDTVDG